MVWGHVTRVVLSHDKVVMSHEGGVGSCDEEGVGGCYG